MNYGPGEAKLAHTPEESVRLDDLEKVYATLQAVLGGA